MTAPMAKLYVNIPHKFKDLLDYMAILKNSTMSELAREAIYRYLWDERGWWLDEGKDDDPGNHGYRDLLRHFRDFDTG